MDAILDDATKNIICDLVVDINDRRTFYYLLSNFKDGLKNTRIWDLKKIQIVGHDIDTQKLFLGIAYLPITHLNPDTIILVKKLLLECGIVDINPLDSRFEIAIVNSSLLVQIDLKYILQRIRTCNLFKNSVPNRFTNIHDSYVNESMQKPEVTDSHKSTSKPIFVVGLVVISILVLRLVNITMDVDMEIEDIIVSFYRNIKDFIFSSPKIKSKIKQKKFDDEEVQDHETNEEDLYPESDQIKEPKYTKNNNKHGENKKRDYKTEATKLKDKGRDDANEKRDKQEKTEQVTEIEKK
jgi:hypothetical protein